MILVESIIQWITEMPARSPKTPRSRSFFVYLLIAMVLLTVIIVGLMSLNNFLTARNLIDDNYLTSPEKSEEGCVP